MHAIASVMIDRLPASIFLLREMCGRAARIECAPVSIRRDLM